VIGSTLLTLATLAGCGRQHGDLAPGQRSRLPHTLAVRVFADTGRSLSLAAPPPDVNVSLARVAPARAGAPDPPLPPASPDTALPVSAPQAASEAARLLPPILRHPGMLIAPRRLGRTTAVELEVRVDERGRVADVRWAAGDADTAVVRAARQCAEAMEFYPALLAGRPVEVWCRQRFEFTPRH